MENSTEITVLQSIYKSAQTGSQSVEDVLDQVVSPRLKEDLTLHRTEYKRISDRAEKSLEQLGATVKEPGFMSKLGMKLGVEMETMMDTSSSHIAELMINGSTMGIINVTKIMNGYPDAAQSTKDLSQQFLTVERDNIERMKQYLQ